METDVVVPDGGRGRLTLSLAAAPRAVLVLGHGAGGGIDAPELVGLAGRLPSDGITVARFEQPWRIAGRRVAGPAPSLDRAWIEALREVGRLLPGVPLFTGGRSTGARVACRCFAPPAGGLVLSAFPLHPPGRPASSRVTELAGVAGDVLLIQTERDPFGGASEVVDALAAEGAAVAEVMTLAGATHGPDNRSAAGRMRLAGLLDDVAGVVRGFILARLPDLPVV